MKVEWFVGLRYLLSSRKNKFLSVITILSILGIATGVGFLIMVLAVMAGFETDLKDKIVGLDAHITISGKNGLTRYDEILTQIKGLSGVSGAMAFIEGEVLITANRKSRSAILRGIRPQDAENVINISKGFQRYCKHLSIEECFTTRVLQSPIILGSELAADLRFYNLPFDHETFPKIQVISPLGFVGPFGYEPRVGTFRVIESFQSGFYDFDTQLAFVPLQRAQLFFSSGERITGIDVRLDQIKKLKPMSLKIRSILDENGKTDLTITDWGEKNKKLFSAMKLEKVVMFIVLFLIVIIASFVIYVTLAMLVLEKKSEIAVLRTIGLAQKRTLMIFVIDGALIGFTGSVIGFLFGTGLCFLLDRYEFVELPPQYYITTIPIVFDWLEMVLIAILAVVLSVLATILPAFRASQINPAEVLRYD